PFPPPPMNPLTLLPLLAAVSGAPEPPPPPLLRFVAREYAFEARASVVGGRKRIRLVNRGTRPHYIRFLRLAPGKTMADFVALREQGGTSAEWLTPAGGIAPVSPGDSADVVMSLPPGRILVICGYPGPDGRPYVAHGMMRELSVGSPPRLPSPAPDADLALRLEDGALTWSGTPAAGRRTVLVENTGTQVHQALLARLPDGRSLADEKRWFEQGFRTARPGAPAGGVIELRPGDRVWLTMDFAPGRYALLCFAGAGRGHGHVERNEAVEFTIC
ncbi:MAG TPA: hypothetical protein VEX86_07545, partial [Longimicrobium sp.]|nr:hypothetical protein [Longimicrobium sp.]